MRTQILTRKEVIEGAQLYRRHRAERELYRSGIANMDTLLYYLPYIRYNIVFNLHTYCLLIVLWVGALKVLHQKGNFIVGIPLRSYSHLAPPTFF